MGPIDTVLQFMECINRRNADEVARMLTEDHVFIDSLGRSVQGREKMRAGWQGYFNFCPDYSISHEEIFAHGDIVAVFGAAGGTIAADGKLPVENKWQTPSSWMAIVHNGFIQEWRVYADNKPVYDILARPKTNTANR
jgi:ketosteroid isomerase-like protein